MAGGSASVHKVLSNDDLLMEILLRLPVVSLHLFKPVCKQWLSLITSPTFTLTRTRSPTMDPPSGIFILRLPSYDKYDFVSFDPNIPSKRPKISYAHIEKSCNGLLLCYSYGQFSIYNPLIRMSKMLPPIHDLGYKLNCSKYMNLAFDPTKSPCYKVVHVGSIKDEFDDYSIRIQTYSSETGVWSVCDDRFSSKRFNGFCHGIYWNGAIHWLNCSEPFHVKLDIAERLVLTNIQTPVPQTIQGYLPSYHKLFNSHGSLLLLCKDSARSRQSNIYELKAVRSYEWSVKYFVNLDDIMRPFPTLRLPTDHWECCDILSIVLGERDEDSFLVFELSGNILQYKFMSQTVSKLLDLGKGVRHHDRHDFIASFARV